jgi:hypothetical protein
VITVPGGLVNVSPAIAPAAERRPASTRMPISVLAVAQAVSVTMPALASAAHDRLSKTFAPELQKCTS